MITITAVQTVLGTTFFNGDSALAGLVIFAIVLAVIMAVTRSTFKALLLGLPVVFIFSGLGILGGDMLIILVIVVVLGLALTASKVGFGK